MNPISLPEQFRSPLAKLAESKLSPEELINPELLRKFNEFDTPVLLWIEEYQKSARPVLLQVLSERPGALQLINLKDRIFNELYDSKNCNMFGLAIEGGVFNAPDMQQKIRDIPEVLYNEYRLLLTSHDSSF